MKNVYIVSWEMAHAFSSAIKLAEFARFAYCDWLVSNPRGRFDGVQVCDVPVEALAALIKRQSVCVSNGPDSTTLRKLEVQ